MPPRIRSIKPEVWADEKLAGLPRDARLLFLALISNADDDGRMRGSVLFVRAACFPYDPDLDVATLLNELAGAGFIEAYEAEDQSFLFIKNFRKHQKIDRPTPSPLPAPPVTTRRARRSAEASTNDRRGLDEGSTADLDRKGSGGEGKGEDDSQGAIALAPAAVTAGAWESYSSAYASRYGTRPVRNAKANGQFAQLVKRLGADEAPAVAAFYVSHPGQLYLRAGHCVDLLLRDCEKLRMEWDRGKPITATGARLEEQSAENFGSWAKHLKGAG